MSTSVMDKNDEVIMKLVHYILSGGVADVDEWEWH